MWSMTGAWTGKMRSTPCAEADLADGDGLAHADVLARDDGAFKRLQAFLVAFFDADVDANGIAGAELGVSHLAGVLADEL
jgi:hypothetical protein